MSYSNGLLPSSESSSTMSPQRGLPGIGFKLTDDGDYDIDKVIRRDYKKKQALVKWKGYSDDFNSWIPIKDLTTL